MKRSVLFVFLVVSVFYFFGCSTTTSDNVKTSGIYAIFTIENLYGKPNVTAKATLQVGGITGSYIELVGDDELFCDDKKLSVQKVPGVNMIIYTADLPKKNPGEKYVFKFKRSGEEHLIEVTQLKEIHITQPEQSASFKINQDIKIKWEPVSTERIDLEVDGDCIDLFSQPSIQDNGEYIITGGTLKFDEIEKLDRCTATVTVKRYISSGVPKEFDGGNTFSYSISQVNIQIEK